MAVETARPIAAGTARPNPEGGVRRKAAAAGGKLLLLRLRHRELLRAGRPLLHEHLLLVLQHREMAEHLLLRLRALALLLAELDHPRAR